MLNQFGINMCVFIYMQDLLKTAYKRLFQLLGTPDGNEDLCGEHMNDEEVSQTFIYIYQNASNDHTTISKAEKRKQIKPS